jgi:hypothetical protein
MIRLQVIGFFLMVMVFFSIGAVAGIRSKPQAHGRAPFPNLLDLMIIFLSWLAALFAYRAWHRTTVATLIGAGTGLSAGFILYRLLKQTTGEKTMADSYGMNIPVPGIESSIPTILPSNGQIPSSWRSFFRQVGRFQSGILLTAFYFIALMPFGILVGNLRDPLGLKVPPGKSFWKPREGGSQNLEGARRQS